MKAKPFIKWAGGKGQLLAQLDDYMPIQLYIYRTVCWRWGYAFPHAAEVS